MFMLSKVTNISPVQEAKACEASVGIQMASTLPFHETAVSIDKVAIEACHGCRYQRVSHLTPQHHTYPRAGEPVQSALRRGQASSSICKRPGFLPIQFFYSGLVGVVLSFPLKSVRQNYNVHLVILCI